MVKRTAIIFTAFILCGAIGSAQNSDADEYKQVADYVIGYYIKAYIDKKTDETWRKKAFQAEWNKLDSNSFENPISEVDLENTFAKLPTDLNRENVQQKTIDFYNTIKEKRGRQEQTIDELIKLPEKYFEDWTTVNKKTQKPEPRFQEQYDFLKNELGNKMPDIGSVVKDKEDENTKHEVVEDNKSNVTEKQSDTKTFLWVCLTIVAIVCFIMWKSNLSEIKKLKTQIKDLAQEIRNLKQKISEKDNQNELQKEKASPVAMPTAEPKTAQPVIKTPANSSAVILYADTIVDGFFNRVKETPNEDTIFELHLQSAQVATFTIYVAAYQRVIARPSFLDGCEKQVLNDAQKIKIVKKGTAQRQADGKWKIINKLNVIIE